MLDLSKVTGQAAEVGYRPPIVMASALEGTGSDEILTAIADHLEFLESSGRRLVRRQHRVRTEIRARMEQALAADVEAILRSSEGIDLIDDVDAGVATPTSVTWQLLAKLRSPKSEAE